MKFILLRITFILPIYLFCILIHAEEKIETFIQKTSFTNNSIGALNLTDWSIGKDSNENSPILLKNSILGEKVLVFGTKKNEIIFYDLVRSIIINKLQIKNVSKIRSGVYSHRFSKLYFFCNDSILAIDLHNYNIEILPFSPFNYLQESARKYPKKKIENLFRCNTALGVVDDIKDSFLYWGCSTPKMYGEFKGISGVLFKQSLNLKTGWFVQNSFKYFYTAESTQDKNTGYNSGIWHSGMRPAYLPSGHLLLAAGNGSFIPDKNNYGCSLIKISSKSMKIDPIDKKFGNHYISFLNNGSKECLDENADTSSGSSGLVQFDDVIIGAHASNDWNLHVFEIEAGNKKRKLKRRLFPIGTKEVYGQTFVIQRSKDEADVLFWGTNLPHSSSMNMLDVINSPPLKIENDLNFNYSSHYKCVGWTGSLDEKKISTLNLYYSGPQRLSSVYLNKNTANFLNLSDNYKPDYYDRGQSKIFWSPYLKTQKQLKLSYPEKLDDSLKPIELKVYLGSVGNLKIDTENIISSNNKLLKELTSLNEQIFVAKDKTEGPCGNSELKRKLLKLKYRQLFNFSLNKNNILPTNDNSKQGWGLYSYRINKNLDIKLNWFFRGESDEVAPHSSFAVALNGSSGMAFLPIHKPSYSLLKLVSLESGELLAEKKFTGQVHFSMPIIDDSEIYIPTATNGLLRFELIRK